MLRGVWVVLVCHSCLDVVHVCRLLVFNGCSSCLLFSLFASFWLSVVSCFTFVLFVVVVLYVFNCVHGLRCVPWLLSVLLWGFDVFNVLGVCRFVDFVDLQNYKCVDF